MNRVSRRIVWTSLVVVLGAALGGTRDAAAGAGIYAYPVNGQSQEQQQRDEYECHRWAVQQTGFDPSTATPPQQSADGSASDDSSPGFLGIGGDRNLFGGRGNVVSDAGTGAALGAIGGAIAGDAGTGALVGAGISAVLGSIVRSGSRRRTRQPQTEKPRHQSQLDNYQQAYGACMSGRNYQV